MCDAKTSFLRSSGHHQFIQIDYDGQERRCGSVAGRDSMVKAVDNYLEYDVRARAGEIEAGINRGERASKKWQN